MPAPFCGVQLPPALEVQAVGVAHLIFTEGVLGENELCLREVCHTGVLLFFLL